MNVKRLYFIRIYSVYNKT